MAMAALRGRSCSGALVLGVNVQFQPYWTEASLVKVKHAPLNRNSDAAKARVRWKAFAEAGMLSPTGRCRFGDDRADGYVRGQPAASMGCRQGMRLKSP